MNTKLSCVKPMKQQLPMTSQSLVFIDSTVDSLDVFIRHKKSNSQVFTLSPHESGLTQIWNTLQHYRQDKYDSFSVHIVSHGAPGCLLLGTSELSLETLSLHQDQIHQWFGQLPSSCTKSLILYGCNVGAGDAGYELVDTLHQITGATVRASHSPVGHRQQGGSWDLSVQVGLDQTYLAFDASIKDAYAGVLNENRFYRYVENDPTLLFESIKSDVDPNENRIYKLTDQGVPAGAPKFNSNGDGEVGLTLPFEFNYYGQTYTDITVGVNGGIIFGTQNGDVSANNASLPDEQPNGNGDIVITPAIFPYWDDLALEINGEGNVYYEAFDDKFKIEWNNIAHEDIGDGITFQLILYKDSNEIAFVYDDLLFNDNGHDYGTSATVGLSGGETQNDGIEYSQDSAALSNITSIRFLSDPRLVNNNITIQENEAITLSDQELLFSDFDTSPELVQYTISDIVAGTFKRGNQTLTGETITFTQAEINAGSIQFVHDGSEIEPSFNMIVNDPYLDPEPDPIAAFITFDNLNDAPELTEVKTNLQLQENAINPTSLAANPALLDSDVLLKDDDSSDFNGGTLRISYSDGGDSTDQIGIQTSALLQWNGSLVLYDGNVVGTVSQTVNGSDGKDLVINLTSQATATIVEAIIERLTYHSTSENPESDRTLAITVSDGDGGTSVAASVQITVVANNDAPEIVAPAAQIIADDDTLAFTGDNQVLIKDGDAEQGNIQVTLTATNGEITVDNQSDSNISLMGDIDTINTALASMVFTPDQDFTGDASVTVQVNDNGNTGSGGSLTDDKTIDILVNSPPTIIAPNTEVIDEGGEITFTTISISDVDADSNSITAILTVNGGELTLGSSSGLTIEGNNTNRITAIGSLTQLNAALDGLIFTPNTDFNGLAALRIDVEDNGNAGLGGSLSNSATIEVTVNALNDAPKLTVPSTQIVNEDTSLAFNSISITDVDAIEGTGNLQVELSVNHGTLTLGQRSGLTFAQGDGSKDSRLVFTGQLSAINAALNGLSYQGDRHFNGSDILTLTVNDQGNTGEGEILTDTQSIAINIQGVNDAPTNTVPGQQRVDEDSNLVFSTDTGNAIAVDDVDLVGSTVNSEIEVSITVNQGVLTLGRTSNLASITGNGTGRVVMTGTKTAINASLERMGYRGNPDFNGTDTLTITTRDQGNVGINGLLSDTDIVTIVVDPTSDIPIVSAVGQVVDEGAQISLTAAILAEAGVNNRQQNFTYLVTVRPSFGQLELTTNPGVAVTTFTQQQLDASQLVYVHDGSETIVDSFDFNVLNSDGTPSIESKTLPLRINPINDAPIITGQETVALDVVEDSRDNLITFSATDAEGNSLSWRITDTGSGGVATLFDQPIQNSQVISYTPNANFNGTDQIKVEVTDGKGGVDTVTINVAVEATNDVPILQNQPQIEIPEGKLYQFIPDVEDIDGDELTFSSPNLPAWLTLNPTTGEISGVPTNEFVGLNTLILEVFDGSITTKLLTIDLTVLDNEITGSDGADQIEGTEVDNILYGLAGDDQIFGLAGDDQIFAGKGQDSVFGDDGQDLLNGGDGRDRLRGGNDDDKIYGEGGRDRLYGDNGNDTLLGGGDRDRLIGGNGNDWLIGGEGKDVLKGSKGNDLLEGNQGNNQLWGNAGKDIFVFDRKGLAIIKDFENKKDKFVIDGKNAKKLFNQLGISQQGKDTTIEYKNQVLAILEKTKANLINKGDFLANTPNNRGADF